MAMYDSTYPWICILQTAWGPLWQTWEGFSTAYRKKTLFVCLKSDLRAERCLQQKRVSEWASNIVEETENSERTVSGKGGWTDVNCLLLPAVVLRSPPAHSLQLTLPPSQLWVLSLQCSSAKSTAVLKFGMWGGEMQGCPQSRELLQLFL